MEPKRFKRYQLNFRGKKIYILTEVYPNQTAKVHDKKTESGKCQEIYKRTPIRLTVDF